MRDIGLTGNDEARAPTHVGFLLIPGFSLLPFASAIEPLRAANQLSGRSLYRWTYIAVDGVAAAASNGVVVTAGAGLETFDDYDYVFICAGGNPAAFRHAPTFAWLRRLARRGVRLAGVSGGPYLLARARLLAGYRFTIHWEHAAALIEDFPQLDLRRSLFEIDRERLTFFFFYSAIYLIYTILAREHGPALATAVSEWFLQTQVRDGAGPQRMTLRERLGVAHAPLLLVVERMERTLETPTSRQHLAELAGLSLRQLERLFRRHLGRSLGAHYMMLRLDRARDLLRQTSMTVLEIALACGFSSASHFSRSYRRRFGRPPRAERPAAGA